LGKLSFSIVIIWIVIGVSIATLYPIAEFIQERETFVNSDISQSGNDLGNSQTDSNSGNSQVTGSNSKTGFSFDNSQFTSSKSQTNVDSGKPLTETDSNRKYLVDNFYLNITNFTAEITNPDDAVTGDGYYEIKTNPSSNHNNVLQSGTFLHSIGTFTINGSLTFTPTNNEKYHILVYSNYPEHDNRVSKDEYQYTP
jgi:hypothetical protein